jgi:hypothetical protein
MPARKGRTGAIQRVLIFDDHPETLRLLLEGRAKSRVDALPTVPPRGSELALAYVLMFSVFILMLWPLF